MSRPTDQCTRCLKMGHRASQCKQPIPQVAALQRAEGTERASRPGEVLAASRRPLGQAGLCKPAFAGADRPGAEGAPGAWVRGRRSCENKLRAVLFFVGCGISVHEFLIGIHGAVDRFAQIVVHQHAGRIKVDGLSVVGHCIH